MSNLKKLFNTMPQVGKVEWISIRPKKRAEVAVLDVVEADPKNGLAGDHYSGKSGKRQVTLIQKEHLEGIAKMLGQTALDPGLVRRNIVVSGINLLALKDQKFQIGEAILETTGHCHPCSRMEENLGKGGYNMMRGHGGITARILQGGVIRLGDEVHFLEKE